MAMGKPKIRFKGYEDDWEQRKLDNVAEFSKGRGYSKGDLIELGTPIILYGRLYTNYETSISDVDTYVEAKDGSVYSRGGEVIVPASGESAEDIARAATVDKSGILLGGDLNVVMPNEDINSGFLAISISNGNPQRELAKRAQGKSVVHIHNEEIRNLRVPFPIKVEQNKIVEYFFNLDHLITLHQRKCEETKSLKKYMLQKMFPENGKCVPKIRFSGFSDAWEQRKLSEITIETYGGGTPKTANEEFWKGDIPWIQSSDLVEECLFDVKPRKSISQEAVSKSATKLVPQNSIAIVTRVGVGKLAFMPFSYATSQDFLSISELKTAPEFTVYALYRMMQLVSNEVQGTSIKGITKDELLAKKMLIPSRNEQKKIGTYLHIIDHLITLHQHKCDELQKLKKFMLQNMFV